MPATVLDGRIERSLSAVLAQRIQSADAIRMNSYFSTDATDRSCPKAALVLCEFANEQ
ncbi:MAG: hypothetical protein WA633_11415 [Stellaceae bacterium]